LIQRIISGGQTGVDRAALDIALELGMECGGWCPKGRRAEDGVIARRYPLEETPKRDYIRRTEWNVRDADGTLVLCHGRPSGGTAKTLVFAKTLSRPWLVVDLAGQPDIQPARAWLAHYRVSVLNIAGPRESQSPGIYGKASAILRRLLQAGPD